jgi:hypothetical protein
MAGVKELQMRFEIRRSTNGQFYWVVTGGMVR